MEQVDDGEHPGQMSRQFNHVKNASGCNIFRLLSMFLPQKVRDLRASGIPAILVTLGIFLSSMSSASVCEDPGAVSHISAGVVNHGTSMLAHDAGRTEQKNQDLSIVANAPGNIAAGFSHEYTQFDFDGIDPQTNAHVHSSAFPLHWRRSDLRIAGAPTLAASSNVMGHPQQYESDTFQVALAVVWQRRLSEAVSIRYGLCGDDRFGDYRLYPAAAIEWHPHPDWKMDLGFPASRITYRIGDFLSTELRLEPDGGEWHVMNREFDAESLLIYEAWAAEWRLALEAGSHLVIAASFGRQLRNRFEMTLQSGARIAIESDDANRVGAEVQWRF